MSTCIKAIKMPLCKIRKSRTYGAGLLLGWLGQEGEVSFGAEFFCATHSCLYLLYSFLVRVLSLQSDLGPGCALLLKQRFKKPLSML
jgi:hypothetical protein